MRVIVTFILIFIFSVINGQDNINSNAYNIFYYGNGNISSEGIMKDGKPDGFWKTYYVNGKLKSAGIRNNFLLDSIWLFYYDNGKLKESISYLKGKKNGYLIKYQNIYDSTIITNHIPLLKELYLNNLRNGKSMYYYPDGKIRQVLNYKNDKKHGICFEFSRDSIIQVVLSYHNNFLTDREIINNNDENGRKQGVWKEFFSNDNIKIEAGYIDNKLHGLYREYNISGRIIKSYRYEMGDLAEENAEDDIKIEIDNKLDAEGKIISSGGYRGDIPVGTHREYTEDEDIIKTKNYNDFGKVIAKGNVNSKGYKQGEWEFYYNGGAVKSTGSYLDNKKERKWVYYYPSGQVEQTGNYKQDKEDGYWEWFYQNADILRTEHFYNGMEDGEMTEYSELGIIISRGEFIEGLKEGNWVYRVGDHSEKGVFKYGLREGIWKHYYDNGELKFEGKYIQGNADGKHKYYYENGKLQEERVYIMGRKEKVWKKFDPAGNLIMFVSYRNDEEVKIDGIKIEKN